MDVITVLTGLQYVFHVKITQLTMLYSPLVLVWHAAILTVTMWCIRFIDVLCVCVGFCKVRVLTNVKTCTKLIHVGFMC